MRPTPYSEGLPMPMFKTHRRWILFPVRKSRYWLFPYR